MRQTLHNNKEYVERSLMRPMAEAIVEKFAYRRGCEDAYVDKVELGSDGKCNAYCVFIYEDREERETIKLYYSFES